MIKNTYEWKELSNDGLLKDVADEGPYYSTESLNRYGGFDSKEEAIERLEAWSKRYKFSLCSNLVLIEFYGVIEDAK